MDSILVKFEPLNLHIIKKQDLVDLKRRSSSQNLSTDLKLVYEIFKWKLLEVSFVVLSDICKRRTFTTPTIHVWA